MRIKQMVNKIAFNVIFQKMDQMQWLTGWLLAFISIIGAITLVVSSLFDLHQGHLIPGITSLFGSVLLLMIALLIQLYINGPAQTGGGKNPQK